MIRPTMYQTPPAVTSDERLVTRAAASAHPGVCNNVLAPGTLLDVPSNNAVVNGIPVEVSAG